MEEERKGEKRIFYKMFLRLERLRRCGAYAIASHRLAPIECYISFNFRIFRLILFIIFFFVLCSRLEPTRRHCLQTTLYLRHRAVLYQRRDAVRRNVRSLLCARTAIGVRQIQHFLRWSRISSGSSGSKKWKKQRKREKKPPKLVIFGVVAMHHIMCLHLILLVRTRSRFYKCIKYANSE